MELNTHTHQLQILKINISEAPNKYPLCWKNTAQMYVEITLTHLFCGTWVNFSTYLFISDSFYLVHITFTI